MLLEGQRPMGVAQRLGGMIAGLLACAGCAADASPGQPSDAAAPASALAGGGSAASTRLVNFPADQVPAVLAVAQRAGLRDIEQILGWGANVCTVIERDQPLEPDLTRQRVASLDRGPEGGWTTTVINTYDFAHVNLGSRSLRIPVGGKDRPDAVTARRVVLALVDWHPEPSSGLVAVEPENIRGLWRPPEVAPEVLGDPSLGHAWKGPEIEVDVGKASAPDRVIVVELDDGGLRVLGGAAQFSSGPR
jgi:hypothetical protein